MDKIEDIKKCGFGHSCFDDEQGKFKTTNIKINDLIVKDENAAKGIIPIDKKGKFKPSGWALSTVFANMVERVNKRGDDMTGTSDMSNNLSNIKDPEDAVKIKYVDEII